MKRIKTALLLITRTKTPLGIPLVGLTVELRQGFSLLVWAQDRPIACVAWSNAPHHIGARDRYIGWSQQARRRNIRLLAYNTF